MRRHVLGPPVQMMNRGESSLRESRLRFTMRRNAAPAPA